MLRPLFHKILELVFPVQCEACGVKLSWASPGVCSSCQSQLKPIPPPHCPFCGRSIPPALAGAKTCGHCGATPLHFDRAFACTLYEGRMKELLRAYKFDNRKFLSGFFSQIMERFIQTHLETPDFDAIAAIPLDSQKKQRRGFNQSGLLAKRLAKRFGWQNVSKILWRSKSDAPQSLLTKKDRPQNVRGRFHARRDGLLKNKHILLVDDILTTGHTASECAKALKGAGARVVTVLALARGA